MEIIIYAAVSANGQILVSTEGFQTPVEVLQNCIGLVHQTGNMVVGLNTYRLFFGNPEAKKAFEGIEVVVLSGNETLKEEGFTFLKSIEEVIVHFKAKGHAKVFVAGGAYTYQMFANGGYMDELYLTYIPVLTGNGTPIVTDTGINKPLALIGHEIIADNIIQLHYSSNG